MSYYYDNLKRNVEIGRKFEINSIRKEEMLNKDLAKMETHKLSQKYYKEGYVWFKSGKKLEEATKEITMQDQKMQLKDNIYFMRGYQAAIIDYGYSVAFHGDTLESVDEMYREDKYFLQGYKEGIEAIHKQTKKTNKTK